MTDDKDDDVSKKAESTKAESPKAEKAEPKPAEPPKAPAPRRVEPSATTPAVVPQRVLPAEPAAPVKKKRGKWFAALAAAAVVIAALAVGGFLLADRSNDSNNADSQIRSSVDKFAQALGTGDIQALRTTSCGPLADYYKNITDEQFADVYRVSVQQKNIPVVQSIDEVQITDKHAIAQVTAYTQADPNTHSVRTFNLEETADGWKVCDPPAVQ